MMKAQRKIKPGQPGTKKWLEKYGSNLICVRYKYDEEQKKRITTIEIIVEEKDWNVNQKRIPKNKIVGLKVEYGEVQVARLIKAAGGKWNKSKKVWELPYKDVLALGLEPRLVAGETKNVQ